jgi:cyclophilin family peptidyl-prolyl cis-trans isomerase
VVPGFVVQGGDPQSKKSQGPEVGSGGSGTKLNAEFNSRKHLRGVVSMARTMDPNSADSQFYICLGTIPHLDGQYTVFGKVIDFGNFFYIEEEIVFINFIKWIQDGHPISIDDSIGWKLKKKLVYYKYGFQNNIINNNHFSSIRTARLPL